MAFCQHMTRLGFLKEELWEKIMADLASKNRYAPFLEKPIMIADNVDEESDSSDKEQKGDSDFKYRGNLFPKNSNVITRKQNHQVLRSVDNNINIL
ncbi:unnamed protein product [Rhizophagus irregularis]|nr:unnamed protein product [Rhizophagus irregularis]CAB5367588.1 unnamed protein product [Rhizophagus irregularis]